MAAVASLVMNVSLFAMSVLHIALVEGSYGHECSSSLAFTACVFAGAAVLQSVVMLVALQMHRGAFLAPSWERPVGVDPAREVGCA